MQPLVLDIRGNPIEDAYLTLADKMLSKTVILGWDIKKLQRKADCLIDLTSYIYSFDKVDHSKKLKAYNPLKVVSATEDIHILVSSI
jgi:hypothetical protein